MKAIHTAEVTLDRTSTREELREVMELLCSPGKPEFIRRADLATAVPELLSEVIPEDDAEQDSADEMISLTDFLLGQAGLPN